MAGENHLVDLTALAERAVVDREGARLGEIDQVLVDVSDGRIDYIILLLNNERLGDHRRIAIPWSQFRLSADNEVLQLDMSLRILRAVARRHPAN